MLPEHFSTFMFLLLGGFILDTIGALILAVRDCRVGYWVFSRLPDLCHCSPTPTPVMTTACL